MVTVKAASRDDFVLGGSEQNERPRVRRDHQIGLLRVFFADAVAFTRVFDKVPRFAASAMACDA